MSLIFEWDAQKAKANHKKHGVSFEEAATVFGDFLSLTIPDYQHSFAESRYSTIGVSHYGKTIVVIHEDKGDNVRVISARLATKYEKKSYEESKKK